ncbi:MAG TPA: CDP-diacylglycerol O-phosphatidyltransferase [Candidatus Binatia bacterium]|nr:CDP-diacylglycerol O-phosphatidyltransferase [Candidatus Binatia bacterium]
MRPRVVAAWGVHLLTASGAPAAVLALLAIHRGDVRTAFWLMAYTLAVDAIDGTLARAVGVRAVLPWVDGSRLDDVVDYATYVIVPALFLVEIPVLPPAAAVWVAALVTVASGYGFAHTQAKTADHFFTGFPSYWNVVVFYVYALRWPPALNAVVVIVLAIAVFVPLRYVYPSRTPTLRGLTVGLGLVWGAALVWVLIHLDRAPRGLVVASLLYPLYYFALSVVLHVRARLS